MMKILVFGSLNIDHTYQVEHMLRMGETLASYGYTRNVGGKGFNQAIALSRAGADVCFAGAIGADGVFLADYLRDNGVDTTCVEVIDEPTGHAIIQVDKEGRNSILLFGGANQKISDEMIEKALSRMQPGDWILLQNEINEGDRVIRAAHARGLQIVLNPSPVSKVMLAWPLELVSCLLLNEVEGEDITGKSEPQEILDELLKRYPEGKMVLTLGEKGAVYADAQARYAQDACKCNAVDTTAAGDTFTGYFLEAAQGGDIPYALRRAAQAAAIAVERPGAAAKIPLAEEVLGRMQATE